MKIRSTDPYEKTEYLPVRFRGFIDLIRPFTLLAPLIGGLAGGLMGASYVGWRGFDLPTLIYGAGSLVLVNAASNTINQVYDLDIDRINKPYRPLPKGVVSVDEAYTLSWFLYLIALLRAVIINAVFGTLVFILIIITIMYSAPPFRLKKRLWISNISIALARGMLGIVAGWTIFGPIEAVDPWAMGAVLFIYLIGATTTKDLTDIEGDRKFGMNTLPVVYGIRHAVILSTPFFVLAYIVLAMETTIGLLRPESRFMTVLIFISAYIIYKMIVEGDKKDATFENSPVWVMMYLQLMLMQLWFAFIYIK